MKVVHLLPALEQGGVESVVCDLVRESGIGNQGSGIRWESVVVSKGNRIVTPSRFLADYLKVNYGTPETKIRVIPNSVDFRRFDPDNLDQAFIAEKRREWGIREDDHVIMAIGRITPVKGLDNLIREFAATKSDHDRLVIVGGADKHHLKYLESLKKLASTVHLRLSPSPIIFAGQQAKIPECISIADEIVSANTVKPETFGLSVVEAYAMNKPVRAKRFGGVGEVMEAVEGANAPSLREAVRTLYSSELQAARTLALYREVVGRRGYYALRA